MDYPIVLGLVVVALLIVLRVTIRSVTVFEFGRGLKYRRGRFKAILGPGSYWRLPRTSIQKLDTRQTFVSITGQEVLSSDGVTLKLSLAARYQVADPAVAVNEVEDFRGALYLELQLALRQIVGATPIEDLLATRQEIGQQLLAITAPKAESIGVQLLEVEIKDVMFPGELKKIFSQVVKARQEGLAAPERARGETAALRNLSNAARLLERTPMLMQLRLLQAIGETRGNTVVLGVPPQSGTPLPISAAELPPSSEEEGTADGV